MMDAPDHFGRDTGNKEKRSFMREAAGSSEDLPLATAGA
jgi:hypothetical protein